jgi:hypothetical protein
MAVIVLPLPGLYPVIPLIGYKWRSGSQGATSGLSVKVKGGTNEVRLDLAAEGIEVGRHAPLLPAHGPDGNFLHEADLRGRYVLLACWYGGTKDPATENQFTRLREVRREFAVQEKLLIVSLCVPDRDSVPKGGQELRPTSPHPALRR